MTLPKLRVPSSVQFFICEVGLHPTQKPVTLFEYLIKTYTNEGDSVLDNCIGSGTTMEACQNLKRSCIGIEISQEYCDVVRERCFHKTFLDRQVTYDYQSSTPKVKNDAK